MTQICKCRLTRRSMSIRREDDARASLLEQEQGNANGRRGQISDAVAEGAKVAKSGIRGCLGRQPYGKVPSDCQNPVHYKKLVLSFQCCMASVSFGVQEYIEQRS